jgi:DNA-binding winged helix-turn-helix (wHTH) protein
VVERPGAPADGHDVLGSEDEVLSFGPFALYPRTRRLEREARPVRIGDRPLDILLLLAHRGGEVVTKEESMARVWRGVSVEDSAVRVHSADARRALGDLADRPRFVKNVTGRGYSFVGLVSRATSHGRSEAWGSPSGHTRASQLPSRLDRMVGRDEALRELSTLVLERRFVSVVGPGGIFASAHWGHGTHRMGRWQLACPRPTRKELAHPVTTQRLAPPPSIFRAGRGKGSE